MARSRSRLCTASAIAPARPSAMVNGELHGRVDAADDRRARRRVGRARMSAPQRHGVRARAMPARCRSAPTRVASALARECAAARQRRAHRAQRLARRCTGSSRSSKSITPAGRVAYGPVRAQRRPALLRRRACSTAAPHALRLGDIERHRLARAASSGSRRARSASSIPPDLDDYIAHGGYAGLSAALAMHAADIVRAVTESGLRGRGGAAFPTGIKWQTVHDQTRGAEIHRLQCGRRRFGHVLRSHAHGRRSVLADRRHDHRRRSRSAPRAATSICASNIRTRRARWRRR